MLKKVTEAEIDAHFEEMIAHITKNAQQYERSYKNATG